MNAALISNKQTGWVNLNHTDSKEYTVDDIINAYQKGCDTGFAISLNKMKKELRNRLNEVLPIIQQFYNSINENASACKLIFLKLAGINKFDFIVALDKDLFYNDDFCRPIYESSFDISDKYRNVGISFMPYSNDLNYESLKSDNFIAVYGKSE